MKRFRAASHYRWIQEVKHRPIAKTYTNAGQFSGQRLLPDGTTKGVQRILQKPLTTLGAWNIVRAFSC
jgi:hypothetical protein